jgi:hypothetical protein
MVGFFQGSESFKKKADRKRQKAAFVAKEKGKHSFASGLASPSTIGRTCSLT